MTVASSTVFAARFESMASRSDAEAISPARNSHSARCHSKPKASSHLATDVEVEFKQRWVDKRVNELVGQGMSPNSARAQAEGEFRDKYSVTNVAHQ